MSSREELHALVVDQLEKLHAALDYYATELVDVKPSTSEDHAKAVKLALTALRALELPPPARALDALCSDHRNVWARFAAVALAHHIPRSVERERTAGTVAAWADAMTEEWKRRFG